LIFHICAAWLLACGRPGTVVPRGWAVVVSYCICLFVVGCCLRGVAAVAYAFRRATRCAVSYDIKTISGGLLGAICRVFAAFATFCWLSFLPGY